MYYLVLLCFLYIPSSYLLHLLRSNMAIDRGHLVCYPMLSTECTRVEWEFQFSGGIVNSITGLLVIAINVCKPPYSASNYFLEVFTMLIKQDIVCLIGHIVVSSDDFKVCRGPQLVHLQHLKLPMDYLVARWATLQMANHST
jgi:hypothetical protein